MLKTRNIGAYRDLLVLFTRYGLKDFRLSFDPAEIGTAPETEGEIEPDVQQRAHAFAESLKRMGPAYVKFGQVLSTRPDIVPPEYIDALETLQDEVGPFSFAEVERIVEEELGVRISKAFQFFDSQPLATASLGQVHRAELRDGRDVVVKVQRPDIRDRVQKDMEVFTEIAETLQEHTDIGKKMDLVGTVEQARITLVAELNYVQEAQNAETLRQNLAEFPQIYIPRVIHDYSTQRVLTTELVKGQKVSKLTPLQMIDADYAELANVLTRAYLKQICVDGFWHSDPHPGNVFIREDGGEPQVVLIDFGMVSRISREFQDEIVKLLLAISGNHGTEVAEACIRVSDAGEQFDAPKFVREISSVVARLHDADVGQINVGAIIFNLISIANSSSLRPPPELAMLAKTLLNLDGITQRLDPDYDPEAVIRDYAEKLVTQKIEQKFNPRNFYPALLDLNQLALDLPHRAREILDETAAGKLTFGIKLSQAEEFLAGIHKVANRIAVGTIIAALLIASALIMRVPTRFALFGYPVIALIGYLIAAAAGIFLVATILIRDHKAEQAVKMKGK